MAAAQRPGSSSRISEIVVCVTVRLPVPDPRSCEETLARLWADGVVEVLDGAVLRWPAEAALPRLRPMQNLPRLAALPHGVWHSLLTQLTGDPPSDNSPSFLVSMPALSPGSSAILAFCSGTDAETLLTELSRDGADVATTVVDATLYASLRACDSSTDRSGL